METIGSTSIFALYVIIAIAACLKPFVVSPLILSAAPESLIRPERGPGKTLSKPHLLRLLILAVWS